MLTFLGCLVPREVIRRIHTIIPKESFLFHVKVSVMNCAVRPLLFERLMNVCSMDCQDYLFVFHHVSFMFDRFLLAFHHFPLICSMRFTCFDNVHSCFQLFWYVVFYYYSLIGSGFEMFFFLIFYWHLRGFEVNVTSCSLIFQLFFVKMEVGHTICSPTGPSTIVNMDDGGKNLFSITVPC